MVEEIVPRKFHKCLKILEKKKLEKMPVRKILNHAINLREGFVPKKRKIYPLLRIEREEVQEFMKDQLIKKENEWKTAFSIPEGAFEPTVMFFGLTNLQATFQTMINDLLRDIIEAENVAEFIDNIIVGTKIEEKHNNIVEEILKRMVENDLFVKLEKCV